MDDIGASFTLVDYIVFILTLLISFLIGIASAFKGNKSPEEFLLGNRSLGAIPVSMSLLTSFVSAINIIGFTTEVYAHGTQLSLLTIGCIIGITGAIFITLPVLYPLKLTSVHEYIEMRFKSSKLRVLMTILILFHAQIFMGVCLYATAVAVAAVTPLDYTTFVYIMGVVCTIYSTVGGIRAVVWTDVFQFVIIMVGLLTFIIAGIIQAGGFDHLLTISKEGGRLELFNMNPSIYERHNFYNTIIFGMFYYGTIYSISQVNLQRVCAVPTFKDAKIVLITNIIGMIIIHIVIFVGGLVVYALYAGCDPFTEGKIQKLDEILSYTIVNKLNHIYGLPGIFVATIISSTLSTFSSVVNAQVALVWKDCFSKYKIFSHSSPFVATSINKILTLLIGLAYTGMALLTSKAKSIIQLVLAVGGITFGSIYGVFILGMCFPMSNVKGAWCGLIGSWSLLTWIYIGAIRYGKPPDRLPFSTDLCESDSFNNYTLYENESLANISHITFFISNGTYFQKDLPYDPSSVESFPLMYLYGISYTLYSVIGPLLCIAIGIIISYITGPTNIEDIDPKLISPLILKHYSKKTLLNESNINTSNLVEKSL